MIMLVLGILSGLTDPFRHTSLAGLDASSTQFTQFGLTERSE